MQHEPHLSSLPERAAVHVLQKHSPTPGGLRSASATLDFGNGSKLAAHVEDTCFETVRPLDTRCHRCQCCFRGPAAPQKISQLDLPTHCSNPGVLDSGSGCQTSLRLQVLDTPWVPTSQIKTPRKASPATKTPSLR